MKIVVDTNVVASSIFFGGKPRQLLEMVYERKFQAVTSPEIIKEYQATVKYIEEKYNRKEPDGALLRFIAHSEIISVTQKIEICRDPDDNKFIECALEGKCIYIVSGDKDLLTLKQHAGIEIITVAEFLNRM